MKLINQKELEMIMLYKKTKDVKIIEYFFEKYSKELINIIFYKINKKFISVPLEKNDLFYVIWDGIKKSLNDYKKCKYSFNVILYRNCYTKTIKEARRFLKNGELILNLSESYEQYVNKPIAFFNQDKNLIAKDFYKEKIFLQNLIDDACIFIKKYPKEIIKNVLYLKSIGKSVSEISNELKISRHYINELIKSIEKIAKKYY